VDAGQHSVCGKRSLKSPGGGALPVIQRIQHGAQPRRGFRMRRTRLVQQAGRMREHRNGHGIVLSV